MGIAFDKGAFGGLDHAMDMIKSLARFHPQPVKQAKDHQRCGALGWWHHVKDSAR